MLANKTVEEWSQLSKTEQVNLFKVVSRENSLFPLCQHFAIELYEKYKCSECLIYLWYLYENDSKINTWKIHFETEKKKFIKWMLSICIKPLTESIFSIFPIDVWNEIFDYLEYCPWVSKKWIQIFYLKKRHLHFPIQFSRKKFIHLVVQIASFESSDDFLNQCIPLFIKCRILLPNDYSYNTFIYYDLLYLPFAKHQIECEFFPYDKYKIPQLKTHEFHKINFCSINPGRIDLIFPHLQKMICTNGLQRFYGEKETFFQLKTLTFQLHEEIFINLFRWKDDGSNTLCKKSIDKFKTKFPQIQKIIIYVPTSFKLKRKIFIKNVHDKNDPNTILFSQQVESFKKKLNVNIIIRFDKFELL